LAIVTDPADVPQTKPKKNEDYGNPKVGHFPYGNNELAGVEEDGPYCIDFGDGEGELDVSCDDTIVIAAHAVVKKYVEETTCIDFENYNEKDSVTSESTPNGPVNFYMTSYASLKTLELDGYAALPNEGSPIVAAPGTTPVPPSDGYENIVAFTIFGDYSRDDEIADAAGTGADGNTLTDPQDLSQIPLLYHAYAQGLAIVIDVSSVKNVTGLNFATIDLDHYETWNFLYFDEDNKLIHKITLTGDDKTGDGVAYPIEYDGLVSKVAIFGGMNNGVSDSVGYAIDQVCVTYLMEESESAWGAESEGEIRFVSKGNWATYFEYTVDCPVCFECPGITASSGNIELLNSPPANVSVGMFENNEKIRVWKEFEGTLTSALQYDLDEGDVATIGVPEGHPYSIDAETRVCIFYVHYDGEGEDSLETSGSITFGANILGVIFSGGDRADFASQDLMFAADELIGYSGTTYPPMLPIADHDNYMRGYDINWGINTDDIVFNVATVDFSTFVSNAHDSFRVIVPMVSCD